MTPEDARQIQEDGLRRVQPIVEKMTNLIMDAYQEGFKTCWELLTKQKWD